MADETVGFDCVVPNDEEESDLIPPKLNEAFLGALDPNNGAVSTFAAVDDGDPNPPKVGAGVLLVAADMEKPDDCKLELEIALVV